MKLNNEQYRNIEQIYEVRRRAWQAEMTERKKEVCEKVPGYRETDAELIDLFMKRATMFSGGGDIPDISPRIKLLSEKKKKLLTEAGYPADYTEVPYVCPLCMDTGYTGNEKCGCFKKFEIEARYDASNLKEWVEENNFERLREDFYEGEELKLFKHAVDECRDMIEHFDEDKRGLLLYGTAGTGKSFLSGCVAKEMLDRDRSVVYYGAAELFPMLADKAFSDDREELGSFMDLLYECDLLIVDDLGTEKSTDFTYSRFYMICNKRMMKKRPMIISSNMDLKGLGDAYRDRIFSRVISSSRVCRLDGPDIRMRLRLESQYG